MNNEENCIVCLTAQMGTWNPLCVVKGSIVKQCGICGVDVVLSISGQELLAKNPGTNLACLPCIQKKIEANPEHFDVDLVPGAVEEGLAHIDDLKVNE